MSRKRRKTTARGTLISAFKMAGKVFPPIGRTASKMVARDMLDGIKKRNGASFLNDVAFVALEKHLQHAGYDLGKDKAYIDVLGLAGGKAAYDEIKATHQKRVKADQKQNYTI